MNNKLVIAYHAYMYADKYMPMMSEQFRLLLSSGLFKACDKLYIGITLSPNMSPVNGEAWVNDFWKFSSSKEATTPIDPKIEIVIYPDNQEETKTLMWIRDYAKANPDDYVLYFHTKGITKMTPAPEDWRHYMEYFAIEKWKNCVQKLNEDYDCCGVMWNSDTPVGHYAHFSGGMWWAKCSYINTLNHDYLTSQWRYHREFWIGSAKKVRQYEFHDSGLNNKASLIATQGHYKIPYPRKNYAITNTLHVICTAFERPIHLRRICDCFLLQSCENWKLTIVHDGKAPQKIIDVMNEYVTESRITFVQTEERVGNFGHPNRKRFLQEIKGEKDDFVLITNEDNIYVDVFVEYFLRETNKANVGMVFCNTIHSYSGYDILNTQVRENYIDMGSFIVRLSVAQETGFNHLHLSADGRYAVECYKKCQEQRYIAIKINKALFIHS